MTAREKAALEERDALDADVMRLRQQVRIESGELNAARNKAKQAKRVEEEALVADFRTGREGGADKARLAAGEAAKAVEVAERRVEAVNAALKGVEADVERLLRQHRSAFFAEAEADVQEAIAALVAAEEPLRRAVAAWNRPIAKWNRLSAVSRETVNERMRERGIHPPVQHVDALTRVPAFPLAVDWSLFESARRGKVAPRPAAFQPSSDHSFDTFAERVS